MLRAASFALSAAFAALGVALAGRPALLWLRSQGLLRPTLGWDVPLGALSLVLVLTLTCLTLWLAVATALGRPGRVQVHAALLLLAAACVGARAAAPPPVPPRDPAPVLLDALRRTAEDLDARYASRYLPDASVLNAALAGVPDPGFRRLGRPLRAHARVLSGAAGPQLEPLPEDDPATLYVAVSADRHSVWLTALGLDGILRLSSGKPAQLEAHGGTHNLPGRDAMVPVYPRR